MYLNYYIYIHTTRTIMQHYLSLLHAEGAAVLPPPPLSPASQTPSTSASAANSEVSGNHVFIESKARFYVSMIDISPPLLVLMLFFGRSYNYISFILLSFHFIVIPLLSISSSIFILSISPPPLPSPPLPVSICTARNSVTVSKQCCFSGEGVCACVRVCVRVSVCVCVCVRVCVCVCVCV